MEVSGLSITSPARMDRDTEIKHEVRRQTVLLGKLKETGSLKDNSYNCCLGTYALHVRGTFTTSVCIDHTDLIVITDKPIAPSPLVVHLCLPVRVSLLY